MKRLFIVDLMPFLYKGHFVFLKKPRITTSGMNTSALMGLVGGLQTILKKENPTHLVLAMDPQGPTFRHEMYPEYKAQREKMPEDLAKAIPYAFEVAAALGIEVLQVEHYEADDVMGTLACRAAEQGFEVFVATPDKDAAQLVRPHVTLYRPAHAGDSAEYYDEEKVNEHWHLTSPKQMIDYLALVGDSADNIPGIHGVGEKTAAGLLAQFGTLEEVLAHADEIKGKMGERVKAGAADARMSKTLATICTDVPLTVDFEQFRLKPYDRAKLEPVCAKFELFRLARETYGGLPKEDLFSLQADALSEDQPKTLADVPHTYTLVKTEEEAEALLDELRRAPRIAFDTETAEANGFPSTDPQNCLLVGFSFATEPGKAWYVVGSLIDLFRGIFADPTKLLIGHNVKFDTAVLRRYGIGFGSTPRDTLLAHFCLDASSRHGLDYLAEKYLKYRPIPITRLIGEKVRGKEQLSMGSLDPEAICDYAAEDADVALRLYDCFEPLIAEAGLSRALHEVEEPLVEVLGEMEREGVRVDAQVLRAYGAELDGEILKYIQGILDVSGPGFNPDSPKQLGELLFDVLKLPTDGVKQTATGHYSTEEKTLSRLIDAHPIVQQILDYRACMKLKSTYVDKLPRLLDAEGRVHTTYSQSFAETGRLSSSDPNLQNIPIRTERGKKIRAAFVARDKDHVLLSADYSQIELRLMAAFSQDETMLEAFRHDADIHRETAGRVYGIAPEAVTPQQRSSCKMVNFGIIFGISAFGLSQRLRIPRREAADLIETYFKQYPRVKAYMDEAIQAAREKGYAETVLKRRRSLRDINSRNASSRQAAERDAVNTPIQGSAADLIKVAMVNISRALKREKLLARLVLQIHDELVLDVPRNEVERVKEIVREEMTHALDFGVPLEVGIGVGETWLEAH